MPFYNSKGTIPPKRHTVFKKNKKLLFEQHISREGFSGIYSNLYHLSMPTKLSKVGDFKSLKISKASYKHKARHLMSYKIKKNDDAIKSRVPLMFNNDIIISVCHINKNMDYFIKQGFKIVAQDTRGIRTAYVLKKGKNYVGCRTESLSRKLICYKVTLIDND